MGNATGVISNLTQALNCSGKCDCCQQLQQQINDLNNRLNQYIPKSEKSQIINESVEKSYNLILPESKTYTDNVVAVLKTLFYGLEAFVKFEINYIKNTLDTFGKLLDTLRMLIQSAIESIQKLLSIPARVDRLEADIARINPELSRLFNLIMSVKSTAETALTNSQNALEIGIDARFLARKAIQDINSLRENIFAALQRIEAYVNNRIAFLSSRIDNISGTIYQLLSRLGEIAARLGGLESDLSRLSNRVGSLESNVSGLNNRINIVEMAVKNLYGLVFDGLLQIEFLRLDVDVLKFRFPHVEFTSNNALKKAEEALRQKSVPGRNGIPGKDGKNGKDGVTYFAYLPGTPGRDGKDGKDGLTRVITIPGTPGRDGKNGINGKDGKNAVIPTEAIRLLQRIENRTTNIYNNFSSSPRSLTYSEVVNATRNAICIEASPGECLSNVDPNQNNSSSITVTTGSCDKVDGKYTFVETEIQVDVISGQESSVIAQFAQMLNIARQECRNLQEELYAATPDGWLLRPEHHRPQMIFQFGEVSEDGKLNSPKYQINIPHPSKGYKPKSDNCPIPSYRRGDWEVIYVLRDNSKITIHAINQAEAQKVLIACKSIVDPEYLESSYLSKDGWVKASEPLAKITVKPRMAKLFLEGRKNTKPEWVIFFE